MRNIIVRKQPTPQREMLLSGVETLFFVPRTGLCCLPKILVFAFLHAGEEGVCYIHKKTVSALIQGAQTYGQWLVLNAHSVVGDNCLQITSSPMRNQMLVFIHEISDQ